jgi:hypothetical protein
MTALPPADDITALTEPLPAEQLALVSMVFNACVEDGLNRTGIRGGSVLWKRGWGHGINQADAASVHAGAEGSGGASGPAASG